MDALNVEFGKRLVELRKSEGLTRDEFANELVMSVNTLRNYENGLREPGHVFLIQMAKRFNVSTDFLLGVSTKKENPPAPVKADAEELSKGERTLINNYRCLNEDGQVTAQDSVEALTYMPKYKKCTDCKEMA